MPKNTIKERSNQKKKMRLILLVLSLILTSNSSIFASIFDTPIAMVTSFNGKVSFENSTERKIDFATDIYIGDLIKTNKDSSVSLTFYNGCRQETLDQKSLIQVGPSESVIRSGQFIEVKSFDCKIPEAVLEATDSHLKAGLVVRSVQKKETFNTIKKLINNNNFKLKAWTNKGATPIFKLGEPVLLHLVSNKKAYVLINYYSSDGELYTLTPELMLDNHQIDVKKLYTIGRSGEGLIAGNPTGIDYIHIIASDQPIMIDYRITKAKDYYQALKKFVKNNKQLYSEQQIKLTITP